VDARDGGSVAAVYTDPVCRWAVLDRWLRARTKARPEPTFGLIERLHWILLALSLITLIGAVLSSHGVLIIG